MPESAERTKSGCVSLWALRGTRAGRPPILDGDDEVSTDILRGRSSASRSSIKSSNSLSPVAVDRICSSGCLSYWVVRGRNGSDFRGRRSGSDAEEDSRPSSCRNRNPTSLDVDGPCWSSVFSAVPLFVAAADAAPLPSFVVETLTSAGSTVSQACVVVDNDISYKENYRAESTRLRFAGPVFELLFQQNNNGRDVKYSKYVFVSAIRCIHMSKSNDDNNVNKV